MNPLVELLPRCPRHPEVFYAAERPCPLCEALRIAQFQEWGAKGSEEKRLREERHRLQLVGAAKPDPSSERGA